MKRVGFIPDPTPLATVPAGASQEAGRRLAPWMRTSAPSQSRTPNPLPRPKANPLPSLTKSRPAGSPAARRMRADA